VWAFGHLTLRCLRLADIRFFLPHGCGPRRRLLAVVLVLALLWAQSLGLWHGVVHDGHGQRGAVASQQVHGEDHATAPSALVALFSSHEDAADCLFFDQLSHGDAITPVHLLQLPLVPLPALLGLRHACFVARWHARFQARGPPFLR
jgi:hypothetical protein